MTEAAARRGTVRPGDLVRLGAAGLRARRLRAALSAAGIAIGIASLVAVLGISESSRAHLLAALDRLGTNLLRVSPGRSFFGEEAELPASAARMVRRIPAVEGVAAVELVDGTVRRSERIDPAETGGISVLAADLDLLGTLRASVRDGRWLDATAARRPVVVLGAVAAARLGLTRRRPGLQVHLAGRRFSVAGILAPVPLAPEIDRAALVGNGVARRVLGADGAATTVYLRADPDEVARVRAVLAATANPEHPEETSIGRPSDALAARAAAKGAFTALFLGLGAVALVVGAIGIANVMVIGVLERRSEIGLRRALGATRRHIRLQFLAESLVLALVGGVAGAAAGAAITVAYASLRGWEVVVPAEALAGALAASLLAGALAALYPAARAARVAPAEALRSV